MIKKFLENIIHIKTKQSMPFYAVGIGRKPGVYTSWAECQEQVSKFSGPKYKKFHTREEAESFVNQFTQSTPPARCKAEPLQATKQYSTSESLNQVEAATSALVQAVTTSIKQQTTSSSNNTMKPRTRIAIQSALGNMKQNLDQMRNSVTQIENLLRGAESTDLSDEPARKKAKSSATEFFAPLEAPQGYTVVYTDGGCVNNGQPNARAGIGVYWGLNHKWNVSERCPGRQTNNNAEIRAAIAAVTQAKAEGVDKLLIRTDSQFMIKCITQWIHKWKRNRWKLGNGESVKNTEELMILDRLTNDGSVTVKWEHVNGHIGIHGNEEADRLATEGLNKAE